MVDFCISSRPETIYLMPGEEIVEKKRNIALYTVPINTLFRSLARVGKKALVIQILSWIWIWSPAFAFDDISNQGRIDIYQSCYSSCAEVQKASPANKPVLETPFVIEAYCACTCSRVAMRITRLQLLAFKGVKNKRDVQARLLSNQAIRSLQLNSAEKCQYALLAD